MNKLNKICLFIIKVIGFPCMLIDRIIEKRVEEDMSHEHLIARTHMQEILIYNDKTNKWGLWHTGINCTAWYKFTQLPEWIQDSVNNDENARQLIR